VLTQTITRSPPKHDERAEAQNSTALSDNLRWVTGVRRPPHPKVEAKEQPVLCWLINHCQTDTREISRLRVVIKKERDALWSLRNSVQISTRGQPGRPVAAKSKRRHLPEPPFRGARM